MGFHTWILAVGAAVCLSTAQAQAWSAYLDNRGACALRHEENGGVFAVLITSAEPNFALLASRETPWEVPAVMVHLQFAGVEEEIFTFWDDVSAQPGQVIIYDVDSRLEDMLDKIAANTRMAFGLDGPGEMQILRFSLSGSSKAVSKFRDCVRMWKEAG